MADKSGPKVSAKMRKGINLCEEVLGIKYTGKTFEEAIAFLDENMPKLEGVDVLAKREPSDKMWTMIGWIQRVTGEEFKVTTMREASDFIARNKDKMPVKGKKK